MLRVFTVLEELPEHVSALTTNSMCNSELLAEQELDFRLREFISVQLIRDKQSWCCLFQEFFLDISDLCSDRVPLALLSRMSLPLPLLQDLQSAIVRQAFTVTSVVIPLIGSSLELTGN